MATEAAMGESFMSVPEDMTRLQKHSPRRKPRYRTPGPGAYSADDQKVKFPTVGGQSFGGSLASVKRFELNTTEKEMTRMPGPGAYAAGSAFGKQGESKQPSAPVSKFGSSTREDSSSQYYPGMMNAPSVGQVKQSEATPGPGTYSLAANSALISQTNASAVRASSPATSFGGPLAGMDRSSTGALAPPRLKTPGPGTYAAPSMMGKVSMSTKRSHAQPKFSKSDRFNGQQPVSPGVAPQGTGGMSPDFKYASQVSAVGKQALSSKHTLPSFSFGARRSGDVHVTKNGTIMNKSKRGTPKPGPGAYLPISSPIRAVSPVSTKRTLPSYSFGKGKREETKVVATGVKPVPGPGHYEAPSGVGRQASSRKRTMAASSIPRAQREQVAKTVAPGTPFKPSSRTPGPGTYSVPGAVGRQTSSPRRSAPAYRFGNSTRKDGAKTYTAAAFAEGSGDPNEGGGGRDSPGPGQYTAPSSLGVDPRFTHSPKFSFGGRGPKRSSPAARASTAAAVGPGSYNTAGGMGAQVTSRKRTAPRFQFSRSRREQVEKVCAPSTPFMSATVTPGPGTYVAPSAFGKQMASHRPSPHGGKFGTSTRDGGSGKRRSRHRRSKTPGPGSYGAHSSLGRQGASRRRNAPSFRFGTSSRTSLEAMVG